MKDTFAAKEPLLVDCRRPGYSFFFDLVKQEWDGPNHRAIHRICTLMRKLGVQSFVREELQPNDEIENERQDASTRAGCETEIEATRLTFFRSYPDSKLWRDSKKTDILGYVVLLTIRFKSDNPRCYILESVVGRPTIRLRNHEDPQQLTNYYVHCYREFETVIGPPQDPCHFFITGSFFSQQNNLTHVCAHAALRMAINSSPAFQGKLVNRRINELLQIDHVKNKVGKYPSNSKDKSIGVTMQEMAHVIKALDWNPLVGNFVDRPAIDYEGFVYPFIESGYPMILGIQNPWIAHVVAVVGHTLNSDRWTADARSRYGSFPIASYFSTSAWVDHFIVNDDNFGMYVTVPTDSIRNILVPKHNANLHAFFALGLVPHEVTIDGYTVEERAAIVAGKFIKRIVPPANDRWFKELKEQKLVCRTLIRNKEKYLGEMENLSDGKNTLTSGEKELLRANLPPIFWVTELTISDLYMGNKHKLGDFITNATGTTEEHRTGDTMLFMWLPGVFWDMRKDSAPRPWTLTGHVSILRDNAPGALEW